MNKVQSRCRGIGVAFIFFGIFCLIIPTLFPSAVVYVAGSMLVLFAIALIFVLIKLKRREWLPFSTVVVEAAYSAVLGIALLLNHWLGVSIVFVLLLWIMLFSATLLRMSIYFRALGIKHWWMILILSLTGMLIVLVSFIRPDLAQTYFSYLFSLYFIMSGLGLIAVGYNSKVAFVIRMVDVVMYIGKRFQGMYQKRSFRRKERKQAKQAEHTSKNKTDSTES